MNTNDLSNPPAGQPSSSDTDDAGTDRVETVDTPPIRRPVPDNWVARQRWLLGTRRLFLVNKRHQLRTAVVTMLPVAALLVVANLLFHSLRTFEVDSIAAAAPAFGKVVEQYGHSEMLLGILASVVVLAGVFAVTLLETHRTAGAAFNIGRHLRWVGERKFDLRLTLRKGDNLGELVEPFNEMTEALRAGALEDAERLERLADTLATATTENRSETVASELRKIATEKRQLAKPR